MGFNGIWREKLTPRDGGGFPDRDGFSNGDGRRVRSSPKNGDERRVRGDLAKSDM
jgi:hypothetical protein